MLFRERAFPSEISPVTVVVASIYQAFLCCNRLSSFCYRHSSIADYILVLLVVILILLPVNLIYVDVLGDSSEP